jgi:cystathionine gamma-lyase
MFKEARMMRGARKLVEVCANVQPGEQALVLTDLHTDPSIAHMLFGALLAVDNTTMTPFGQRPLDFGADIVVASDTKAPNGHSDLLFGHVASRAAAILEALPAWAKL